MARERNCYLSGRGGNKRSTQPIRQVPASVYPSLQERPLRGMCQTLCPAEEAAERGRNQELSQFECPVPGFEDLVAVKKYRRSAAGRNVLDTSDLRPVSVLLQTLRHLFTRVLLWPQSGFNGTNESVRAPNFVALYHFVDDRIRSVRQDITVQRIQDASVVIAFQQITRFYLLARLQALQLVTTGKEDLQDWSDQLNDQQLASALSQLQTLYEVVHVDTPEIEEFVAFSLLFHAESISNVMYQLRKLPRNHQKMPRMQQALRVFVAFQTDDFYVFVHEFYNMTLLERVILLPLLPKFWTRSLKLMNKGFRKQEVFPLETLASWLGLVDPQFQGKGGGDFARELCHGHGVLTQLHPQSDAPGSMTQLPSTGFAQFQCAPFQDHVHPKLLKPLLRHVASRIQYNFSGDNVCFSQVIMGE